MWEGMGVGVQHGLIEGVLSSTPVCQRWRSTTKRLLHFPLQALSSPLGILWIGATFPLFTIYQNTFRSQSLPWTLLGATLQVGVR